MGAAKHLARESIDLKIEEAQLLTQISELTIAQKRHYYALEVQQVKDPDTYANLNWVFISGLHHFYLGKWQRGIINLILMLIGSVLFFSGTFALLGITAILLSTLIELPQLYNSQKIISTYNNRQIKNLLKEVTN
jgi:TM2 domain-containing membrane protein YozV